MPNRCRFPDISYLRETQKNNFQFLSNIIIFDEDLSSIFFIVIFL